MKFKAIILLARAQFHLELTRIGLDVSNWLLMRAKRHNDRAGELNAKFKIYKEE